MNIWRIESCANFNGLDNGQNVPPLIPSENKSGIILVKTETFSSSSLVLTIAVNDRFIFSLVLFTHFI